MGRVLNYLLEKKSKGERIHFTLIDPDKTQSRNEAGRVASLSREAGSDAILIGGSTGLFEPILSEVVRGARRSGLPVILFPSNINGLTSEADAVLFMYLLNSDDPYYISGVQVQAAPIVLKMGLEYIPTAYIIVGYGGAAGFIGRARPIPYDKPSLVAVHALAGAMMGAKIIYLEAGSGAPRPVPPEAVSLARRLLNKAGFEGLLVVGGGVRDPDTARTLSKAGADALVTGTIVEEDPSRLKDIISAFKNP